MPFPFWLKQLGECGEYLAKRHFRRKGYFLAGKNLTFGHRELDLVMSNGEEILIMEVKARRPKGIPARISDLVSKEQRNRITAAGSMFIRQKGWGSIPCRYLVIYILFESKGSNKFTVQIADLIPRT